MDLLLEAIKALGWVVCVPKADDSGDISGLVIGTQEYCDSILEPWESDENRM